MKINQNLSYSSLLIGGCLTSYGIYQRTFKRENGWIAIITGVGLTLISVLTFTILKGRVSKTQPIDKLETSDESKIKKTPKNLNSSFQILLRDYKANHQNKDEELKETKKIDQKIYLEIKEMIFEDLKNTGNSLEVLLESKKESKSSETSCTKNFTKAIDERNELEIPKIIFTKPMNAYEIQVERRLISLPMSKNPYLEADLKIGKLIAIFEDDEGTECATFLKDSFIEIFEKTYSENNIKESLETALMQVDLAWVTNMIQSLYWGTEKARDSGLKSGSQVVICFIPKENNTLYTATLGNCEAAIFRKHEKQLYQIPLSVIRKPNQPKERKRIKKNGGGVGFNDKLNCTFDFSRGIGKATTPGLVRKAKVTSFSLAEGDKIVIGSSSFWSANSNEFLESNAYSWIKSILDETPIIYVKPEKHTKKLDNITVGVYEVNA